MLNLGATSFWEKYNPNETGVEHLAMYGRPYGKSLCHSWGASPLYLFGKYYLGVQPEEAGYKTFSIRPILGGLQWIEGSVPTPEGEIKVYMDKTQIKITSSQGAGYLYFTTKSQPTTNLGLIEFIESFDSIDSVETKNYKLKINPHQQYIIKATFP
jgi:hypothetical protein